MKNIIILILAVLFAGTLFAQQPDEATKRTMEREVKTSGNYLYGEATESTKDEAVKMAKTALLSEINKEAVNHPEWQFAKTIQANGVEYDIDMIDLMRGSKYRVIAYIKKDNIMAVFDKNTPKIKVSDKPATQERTPPTAVQSVKSQTATDTKVTPAPEELQPKVEATTVSAPKKTLPVPVVDNHTNTGGLLEQILNASSMPEIQKILNANKRSGKVVSGTMDKLIAPEKAYLIVYKESGEIVAILDKGSRDNRKDLLSGEVKGQEIQTQNQVIWFQLLF